MFEIKNDDNNLIVKLDKTKKLEITSPVTIASNVKEDIHSKPKDLKTLVRKSQLSMTEEISVEQGPLEEVKFGLVDDQDEDESEKDKETTSKDENDENSTRDSQSQVATPGGSTGVSSSESQQQQQQSTNLKLTICEQYQEKLNISRTFKLLKDDLILSCSPFIAFQMPFLLLDCSSDDQLRKYLPLSYMRYLKSDILLRDSQGGALSPTTAAQGVIQSKIYLVIYFDI